MREQGHTDASWITEVFKAQYTLQEVPIFSCHHLLSPARILISEEADNAHSGVKFRLFWQARYDIVLAVNSS